LIYRNKYQLQAQIIFIQAIATQQITKKLNLLSIKNDYSQRVSFQIRKHLVFLFQESQTIGLIGNSFLTIQNDGSSFEFEIKKLNTHILNSAEIILFTEKIHL